MIGERLKMLAAEPKVLTPAQLSAFIADEYQRIGAIMRAAGVKS